MSEPNEREMDLNVRFPSFNEREMELAKQVTDEGSSYQHVIARLLATYRRELAPKWTREVPTVPGNYWHRFDRGGVATVEALYLNYDGKMMIDGWDTAADAHEGEWAGPLPEPEEL